jgi:rhodanese-related sulfurtransferase
MKTVVTLWIAGWLAIFPVSAASVDQPKNITAPEVQKLMESGEALLVHVLSRIEFEIQHIPGSINIPITQMETTQMLPLNKDTPLIFYCMGRR